MKGVVFNLLEEAVVREYGIDVWDDLLDDALLDGAYTALGSYSDDEIVALVAAAAARLNMTSPQMLRWFGERAMPLLKERYPAFFKNHDSSRSFLISVNSYIHPEVRKLYAGAKCPHLRFRDGEGGALTMGYSSSRKMCDLAHGFITGSAKLFCEDVTISHVGCMNDGADECLLELRWAS